MSELVIDTDVVSFGFRQDALYTNKYGPAIQGSRAVISFMTLAELQFGMLNRRWGEKRQNAMLTHLRQHYMSAVGCRPKFAMPGQNLFGRRSNKAYPAFG